MRVLLLGATGNLGLRLLPALLSHNHVVTLYIRNPTKLHALVPSFLLSQVSIVVGDATDAEGIAKALREHDIEAIVDVAGNQVLPWKEYLMPRIANAVQSAAVRVGEERGKPLRAWICCGLGIMGIPGREGVFLQDFFPTIAKAQHHATSLVILPIPVSSLRWTLFGIAMMNPSESASPPSPSAFLPRPHNLLISSDVVPDWRDTWLIHIPRVGDTLNVLWNVGYHYATRYEEVADFIAGDLEGGGEEWVGKKVALKERVKGK